MSKKVKDSQKKKVLEWLKKGKTLTSAQAWTKWGITRLSAIIYELRKYWNIKTEMVNVLNRDGETCRVARYSLVGKK